MVLTTAPRSPRCAGLDSHRHLEGSSPEDLMPASGHQDHTAWSSMPTTLVSRGQHVHRIPPPTSVTIAKRPFNGGRMRARNHIFPKNGRTNFSVEDVTDATSLKRLVKLVFRRTQFESARGTREPTAHPKSFELICPSGKPNGAWQIGALTRQGRSNILRLLRFLEVCLLARVRDARHGRYGRADWRCQHGSIIVEF